MRHQFAAFAARALIGCAYASLPVAPLLASVIFWRRKYLVQYGATMAKARRHVHAMAQGPALHYFKDVAGRVTHVPDHIEGECVQCGNCCMNHQCMFLEAIGPSKYQCGIYHSALRRASNCRSFPLHRFDIERYSCPSYFVVNDTKPVIPIHPIAP